MYCSCWQWFLPLVHQLPPQARQYDTINSDCKEMQETNVSCEPTTMQSPHLMHGSPRVQHTKSSFNSPNTRAANDQVPN
jgi:hypothetical protein